MLNETNSRGVEVHCVRNLSVVVPILNEQDALADLVANLRQLDAEQTIIVDGGSNDSSFTWLQDHWQNDEQGRVLTKSKAGRAEQMNAGAALANSDLLLFLHADSRLPKNAKNDILQARDQQRLWGRFDIAFNNDVQLGKVFHAQMSVIAWFMNLRSRLTSIATGDQAIFVDAVLFRISGGFPKIPLMEDVAMSKILKRHCVPFCSRLKATTSARRWQQGGVIRTVVQMWYFRLAYFLGTPPQRLEAQYRQVR